MTKQVLTFRAQAATLFAALLLPVSSFLLPVPALAAGPSGTCSSNADCTEADCAPTDRGCFCFGLNAAPSGVCEVKRAEGRPCTEAGQCRTDLRCDVRNQRCVTGAEAVPTPTAAPSSTEPTTAPPPTRTAVEFGYVNPLGTISLNEVIKRVIRTALGFVGALFLAMFVYGGTLWMVAGGDAKKVESGRKTLINAVIGMVVIAISYSIISIIFETASVIRGG